MNGMLFDCALVLLGMMLPAVIRGATKFIRDARIGYRTWLQGLSLYEMWGLALLTRGIIILRRNGKHLSSATMIGKKYITLDVPGFNLDDTSLPI